MVCPGLWGHWYKYEDKYTAKFPILSYNQAARTHTSQQMSHTKLLSPRYLILWNKDLVADNKMQMYITFWRWHSLTWHNGKFIKPIVYENILYFYTINYTNYCWCNYDYVFYLSTVWFNMLTESYCTYQSIMSDSSFGCWSERLNIHNKDRRFLILKDIS